MIKILPAFCEEKNCIVLCSDNGFVPATSVMIQSIIEQAAPDRKYDIIILHSRIEQISQQTVISMCKATENVSIRFFDIQEFIKGTAFYTENRKTITEETYYRLFIPYLLDEKYARAIYVDGDMIVRKDIYDVFENDIENSMIGAVRDFWGICNCYIEGSDVKSYRESIGLENINDYIIGGTILFNIPMFRTMYSLEDVLNICSKQEWRQHDQDVINILCKDRIAHLNPKWGWMSDYGNNHYLPTELLDELNAVVDPVIVHFGGIRKPWKKEYTDYDLDFWTYALHTPYFSYLLDLVSSLEYKNYVAVYLSKDNIDGYYTDERYCRFYKNVNLGYIDEGPSIIRVVEISHGVLRIEGMVGFWCYKRQPSIQVFLEVGRERIQPIHQSKENLAHPRSGIMKYYGMAFAFEIALNQMQQAEFTLCGSVDGIFFRKRNLTFHQYCSLTNAFGNSYFEQDGWMVTADSSHIRVKKVSKEEVNKKEWALFKELISQKKKSSTKAAIIRQVVRLLRCLKKKPIWIVSDRLLKADDNGEVFFRFLNREHSKEIDSYFVLDSKSVDYSRLRDIGKVIQPRSARHKILQLLADYSISSQTDTVFRNPFGRYYEPYADMINRVGFVFLQHGIITADLSGWLCKRRQNLAGFVTTVPREFNSILSGGYGYTEKQVWLTGLPRFDALEDHSERIITVIPTWRKYLAVCQDRHTGVWKLKADFSNSMYVRFYRELLQSKRMREAAKQMGYTIQFKLHPSFLGHESAFGFDEQVKLVSSEVSYRDIYRSSSLLITDYSSVINDFLYLRKPVIYCQFDHEEFFSGGHIYIKGDFDYENEGFGEVEYDLDGTIDRIIEYMQNDCRLKDKYRERIDRFFAFNDRENCERVYQKIMGLSKLKE